MDVSGLQDCTTRANEDGRTKHRLKQGVIELQLISAAQVELTSLVSDLKIYVLFICTYNILLAGNKCIITA